MEISKNTGLMIDNLALPQSAFNLFAAGQPGYRVTVWSFIERRKIGEFPTILDFGGPRLALTSCPSPMISTGSWSKGIAAYNIENGEKIWARKDLRHIQQVRNLVDSKIPLIGVSLDKGFYYILRADTGETHSRLNGINSIYVSPLGTFYLTVGATKSVRLTTSNLAPIWKKDLNSFAVLDAAFSPEQLAFSEAGGSVRCFDFYGSELWRFQSQVDHHIMRVVWDLVGQRWLAIDWNFRIGGSKRLFEIDNNGNAHMLKDIGNCTEVQFSFEGTHLITSTGEVIATQSGETVWTFLS